MDHPKSSFRLFALGTLLSTLVAGLGPAGAASTASVSVSDSASTAVGSASDSVHRSSESSTRKERAAAGDYRIVAIAALPDRAGLARLTLQPESTEEDLLFLDLPQATVASAALQAGQRVTATPREYGVEFARAAAAAEARQAFFLVLDDSWYRELHSRPVQL